MERKLSAESERGVCVNFVEIIGFTVGGVTAVAVVARLLLEFALAD